MEILIPTKAYSKISPYLDAWYLQVLNMLLTIRANNYGSLIVNRIFLQKDMREIQDNKHAPRAGSSDLTRENPGKHSLGYVIKINTSERSC